MKEIELYFARQNLLWNLSKYILLFFTIISVILFICDIISRIKYNNVFKKLFEKMHKQFWKEK